METIILPDKKGGRYKTKPINDVFRNNDGLRFVAFPCVAGIQYDFSAHWHTDYEIMLPRSGYVEFTVNGKDYCIKAGEALFVHTGEIHGHKDFLTHEYGEYNCFSFDEKFVFPDKSAHIYHQVFKPIASGTYTFTKHIKGEVLYEQKVLSLLQELDKESSDIHENALSIQIKLLSVFELMAKNNGFHKSDHQVINKDIMIIVKYIHQYYDTQLLVSDLASKIHVSADYLTKMFKEQMGMTPKTYILNYRIEIFLRLLNASPDAKISDIAMKCGFTDPNYFARVFKKKMGLTPTAYAANIRT